MSLRLIAFTLLVLLVGPASGCTRYNDCTFQPKSNLETPRIPEGLGVNIHFTEPRPGELKMLAGAGVRWVRMDFKWDLTEPAKGKYDFAPYERLMLALQPFGIRALFILDYGNPLYDGGVPPRTDAARQAFATWAVAAARHFAGRGVIWETYNEPNNEQFWPPHPNVDEYNALALAVGRAFRAAVPEEKLIGPAIGEMDFGFLEGSLQAGLLEYWSAVSVHPYLRSDPENVAADYCRVRWMIEKYRPAGVSKKEIGIISSEWGYSAAWPGMNEEKQGQLLARQWLTNTGNGVSISIWYDWHDDGADPNDPEHHFGMVSHAYHEGRDQVYDPKPAYHAAKTLSNFFEDYRFEKRLKVESENDYVLVFRNGNTVRFAVWTTGADHTVMVPLDGGEYSGTQHTGAKTLNMNANEKGLNMRLTTAPVYLCRVGTC